MTYVLNPDYGNGVFRRRIRLRNAAGLVTADVEDCFHAFRVYLQHDGEKITAIDSDAIRYPVTICPDAGIELRKFIGDPLSGDRRIIRERQAPGHHCTHQYDLAWLAMAQALRGTSQRIYDIDVPDARDGRNEARVWRDGELILSWQLHDGVISAPAEVASKSPFADFGRWASAVYRGDDLEAAYVLQICVFVAGARRIDFSAMAGTPSEAGKIKPGSCYSYQPERIGTGLRTGGMQRDFTDTPAQLLQFV